VSRLDDLKAELAAANQKKQPGCRTCLECSTEALELIDWWIEEKAAGRMSASMAGAGDNSLYSILVREYAYPVADNTLGRHVRSIQSGGPCASWRDRRER